VCAWHDQDVVGGCLRVYMCVCVRARAVEARSHVRHVQESASRLVMPIHVSRVCVCLPSV
jgi:hypothetical protein